MLLVGIWIAKLLKPFKLLLASLLASTVVAGLLAFTSNTAENLWIFTALLGVSQSLILGALLSWATNTLPGKKSNM